VQVAECRLQSAGCRVQVAECRLQSAGCRVQVAECTPEGLLQRVEVGSDDAEGDALVAMEGSFNTFEEALVGAAGVDKRTLYQTLAKKDRTIRPTADSITYSQLRTNARHTGIEGDIVDQGAGVARSRNDRFRLRKDRDRHPTKLLLTTMKDYLVVARR